MVEKVLTLYKTTFKKPVMRKILVVNVNWVGT